MSSIQKLFICLAVMASGFYAKAQKESDYQLKPIETFPVNAEVVGILEGHNSLAVLKILKVDSNNFDLKIGDEILAEFYFTTKPIKNEAKLIGIKPNDKISVRMHAKAQALNGGWDYTAFHYVVFNRAKEE